MQIEDKIQFGEYDWRVLAIQDSTALIITEDIVEQRMYHNTYTDTTWADCELRKYLNGEFYNKFSAAEKSRVMQITNKNPNNQWYGTNGGEDTQDRVFLLTIEDVVCKFFGDSSDKLYNRSKNQKYWFERKDKNNSKRMAKLDGHKEENWWWLRSPGRINRTAVYIHGNGCIGIQGNSVKFSKGCKNCIGGVRPALWINME